MSIVIASVPTDLLVQAFALMSRLCLFLLLLLVALMSGPNTLKDMVLAALRLPIPMILCPNLGIGIMNMMRTTMIILIIVPTIIIATMTDIPAAGTILRTTGRTPRTTQITIVPITIRATVITIMIGTTPIIIGDTIMKATILRTIGIRTTIFRLHLPCRCR